MYAGYQAYTNHTHNGLGIFPENPFNVNVLQDKARSQFQYLYLK